MIQRRRPFVRSALGKVAITGAASLAAVFTIAPGAFAADEPAPETSEPTPTEPAPTETTPAPVETTPTQAAPDNTTETPAKPKAEAAAVDPLVADFGEQKYRVGVKIADGTTVPEDTTTAGSVIRITETGPNVGDGPGDETYTFTCTTDASTAVEGTTETYCLNPDATSLKARAAAKGGVEVDPDEDFAPFQQIFVAEAGSTVRFSQVSSVDPLVKTAKKTTIDRCETDFSDGDTQYCGGNFFGYQLSTVMFANTLPSETPDDPPGDGDQQGDEDGVLPDTGGSDLILLAYGGALLAGGGGLIHLGRRRVLGQHALVD